MVRDFPQLNKLTTEEVGSVNEALRCGLVKNWKSRLRLKGLEYMRETHGFDWYTRRKENDDI